MAGRFYDARMRALDAIEAPQVILRAHRAMSENRQSRPGSWVWQEYDCPPPVPVCNNCSRSASEFPRATGRESLRAATEGREPRPHFSRDMRSSTPMTAAYRVTSCLGSPALKAHSSRHSTGTSLLAPIRFRSPSPLRYSVLPKFRSRFYK